MKSTIEYENSHIRMLRAQLKEMELIKASLDAKGQSKLAQKLQDQVYMLGNKYVPFSFCSATERTG